MQSLRIFRRLTLNLQKLNLPSQVSKRHIKRWIAPTYIELTKRKRAMEKPYDNPRSTFTDWNRDAEIYAFNKRLSEKFETELLEQALTHRSYIIKEEEEQKKVGISDPQLDLKDNSELIQEGKTIMPLIIENYLFQALPLAPRECIHALIEYLLSTKVLAERSSGIGTKDLVLTEEYPVKEETLANTFYALVAALTRSVDLEHSSIFVRDILISALVEKDLLEIWCPENPVEILNDILDRENKDLVEPRIIAQSGVNTLIPVYKIGLYSNQEFLGSGFGDSIEEAEKLAGLDSLCRMFGLMDFSKPIRCNKTITDTNEKNTPLSEWMRAKM